MIEKLKKRRDVLQAQREQLAANLNATVGAIQVLDELIAECEAQQEPAADGTEKAA
jgi:hypothetical protein